MPENAPLPLIFMVILNWNGKEDTLECLHSLRELNYPRYETIVVDNGSSDGSVPAIKAMFPEITVIENERNLGFCLGNNRGIEFALAGGADYVLIMNNDTTVTDPDLILKLASFAEDGDSIGLVGPKIFYHGSDRIWFAGGRVSTISGFCRHISKGVRDGSFAAREPYAVDYISGCCMLAGRGLLEEVGLFDPAYFLYYEDTDLSFRTMRAGLTNYVVPTTSIAHKKSSTAGIRGENRLSEIQSYYFARNAIIFSHKNLDGWKKGFFLLSQFTLRLAYNTLLMSRPVCFLYYVRGLKDGIRAASGEPRVVDTD
jgi:GT2 family glycosyltransferase